jgi:nucleoside-diphosphate-sugar epimerase
MNEQSWEGKVNPRIWDDIQDIDEIYNLPDTVWHHAIDRWIADASNDKVKTVAICPPDLYGQSTTVGGRTTYMVPEYVAAIMKYKEAFYLGEGQNMRAVTHIDDLTELFVLVLEKHLEGGKDLQYGKEVRKAQSSLSF